MDYQDKSLLCADCGQEFVFTAGEQMFFAEKNFKNEPKRCKDCKSKRNLRFGYGRERVETQVTCAGCGATTTVPFVPTQGRPVYCRDCFQSEKAALA
jgi:CxxC-x17-CxxC domain-containing protein